MYLRIMYIVFNEIVSHGVVFFFYLLLFFKLEADRRI